MKSLFSIRSHRVWSSHEILNITWLHGFAFMLRFYITLLSQCAKKILRHNSFGCNCVTHKKHENFLNGVFNNFQVHWAKYLYFNHFSFWNKYCCNNEILFYNKEWVFKTKMKYCYILQNSFSTNGYLNADVLPWYYSLISI